MICKIRACKIPEHHSFFKLAGLNESVFNRLQDKILKFEEYAFDN